MLLTVSQSDKPRTKTGIDDVICAEIPDPNDCTLYSLVTKHMIHGPCGVFNQNSRCLDSDGRCTKNFLKSYQHETKINYHGFPTYRRRANLHTYKTNLNGSQVEIDNSFVVPCNKFLLLYFRSHINVEVCGTVKAKKYLYKYVCKGYDQANVRVMSDNQDSENDEMLCWSN